MQPHLPKTTKYIPGNFVRLTARANSICIITWDLLRGFWLPVSANAPLHDLVIIKENEPPPAKHARIRAASSAELKNCSTTPGRAKSCCTFLAPASWYATDGHNAAVLRSSISLRGYE